MGASSSLLKSDDWEFIEQMHLARRIYKPFGFDITLAQYAALTRTFAHIVRSERLWWCFKNTNLVLIVATFSLSQ